MTRLPLPLFRVHIFTTINDAGRFDYHSTLSTSIWNWLSVSLNFVVIIDYSVSDASPHARVSINLLVSKDMSDLLDDPRRDDGDGPKTKVEVDISDGSHDRHTTETVL